jgi:hypothetical protein
MRINPVSHQDDRQGEPIRTGLSNHAQTRGKIDAVLEGNLRVD